jgi:hypothetical protein
MTVQHNVFVLFVSYETKDWLKVKAVQPIMYVRLVDRKMSRKRLDVYGKTKSVEIM